MRKLLLLLTFVPCIAFGQKTYVPDDTFEDYLETHDGDGWWVGFGDPTSMGDGIANNDSVPTAIISSVDTLTLNWVFIDDLTGIEDFTALTYLDCSSQQLTSLDVSNNTALTYLDCSYQQLTSLDVSNNTTLTYLYCWYNQLTSLDVSNNTDLTKLDCGWNQLTALDVSNNTGLTDLDCINNQLTCLKLKNGNNTNMGSMLAYYNPNLNCIDVDDAAWATTNWTWGIDPQTSFSEDCNNPCSSTTGIYELPPPNKELLTITDILGRTTQPAPNTLLFYIYEDGSVEKKMLLDD